MRWAVTALVFVAGCDYIFNLHGIDLPPGDARSGDTRDSGASDGGSVAVTKCGAFASPTQLLSFTVNDTDPAERGDHQEMWFSRFSAGTSTSQILGATRTSVGAQFGTSFEMGMFSTGTSHDTEPTVTSDGRDMFFVSDRVGALRVYETVRDTNLSFGNPVYVPLADNVQTIAISADGLSLYIDDGVLLRQADRGALDGPFAPSIMVSTQRITNPSVTGDGLQVYYRRGPAIYRQTRGAPHDSFATEEPIVANGVTGSPTISFDGKTLIYSATTLVEAECAQAARLMP